MNAAMLAVADAQLFVWCGVGLVAVWGLFRLMKFLARIFMKLVLVVLFLAAVLWAIWMVGD